MKNAISHNGTAELESPFLNLTNFKQKRPQPDIPIVKPSYSPFKSVYEQEGMEHAYDAGKEHLIQIMDELYDEDFDEMLNELANEGQSFIESQMPSNFVQNETIIADKLDQHFAPLLREMDNFINHSMDTVDQMSEEQLSEGVFEGLIDNYTMSNDHSPETEYFFKKLKKKFKKIGKKVFKFAKKGVKYAKKGIKNLAKLALKHITMLLKKLLPFLIKMAYKMGLFKKIPKKYRPVTDLILKKLGVNLKKAYSKNEIQIEQQKLDLYIADILTASSPEEFELIDQEYEDLFDEELILDYEILEREQHGEKFVNTIKNLDDEAPTQPVIDEFVSAVLLASKLLGGRKKAVSIVGNYLGGYFSKWLGTRKKDTTKFAKYLIDKGLSKFGFEVSPEMEMEESYSVFANMIEGTALQVGSLPEGTFENEALLENHIVHAFEQAASVYLPDILPEEEYEKRPELKEAFFKKLAWKTIKKKRNRKLRKYKKLNKKIDLTLTPYSTSKVKTYKGNSLKNVLRDRFGVNINKETPAQIHLYETSPESSIYEIASNEEVFNSQAPMPLGIVSKQIFPLTSVASGLLLGEPGLGCKCKSKCLSSSNKSKGAHRFYYLEIPGLSPKTYTSKNGIQTLRNTTNVQVKLNFVKNEIYLSMFLSEADAQQIASELRQHRKENASILTNTQLKDGLKNAFSKHTSQNISIVHPKVIPGGSSGEAFKQVPRSIQENLRDKLGLWTNAPILEYVLNNSDKIIEAADNSLDGITVAIKMEAPSGFEVLKSLVGYGKVQLSENLFSNKKLDTIVTVVPGYDV